MRIFVSVALLAMMVSTVVAAPTLDGTRDASYGPAIETQTVQTQFGDNQSELNAAYAQIESGVLYVMLTGQVESNFNKLDIFIDSVAGGENTLSAAADNGGTNPNNDGWANNFAGFTFDNGFDADYMLIARNGNAGGDRFDLDFATIGGGLSAFEDNIDIFGGTLTGVNASALPNGIGVGYDNSNGAGIGGGSGAADAMAAQMVATGIELAIPLSAIGNPVEGDTIRISAMVNNGDHNFLSNQFLGGLDAPQGNLGGDGGGNFTGNLAQIDLNQFGGDQYFSIVVPAAVPEPSTLVLVAVSLLGLLGYKRRNK